MLPTLPARGAGDSGQGAGDGVHILARVQVPADRVGRRPGSSPRSPGWHCVPHLKFAFGSPAPPLSGGVSRSRHLILRRNGEQRSKAITASGPAVSRANGRPELHWLLEHPIVELRSRRGQAGAQAFDPSARRSAPSPGYPVTVNASRIPFSCFHFWGALRFASPTFSRRNRYNRDSGDTPVLTRVVTACRRIGAGRGGLWGLRPAPPPGRTPRRASSRRLTAGRPGGYSTGGVDRRREPAGGRSRAGVRRSTGAPRALRLVPSWAVPEFLVQLARGRRFALLRPDRLERPQQPRRGSGLGIVDRHELRVETEHRRPGREKEIFVKPQKAPWRPWPRANAAAPVKGSPASTTSRPR